MSETDIVVQTKGLTRCYQKFTAVDHVDLTIRRGEIYGFLGPNGAGKTTTIRMLLGLIRSTSGQVKIFGESLEVKKKEILRRVGSLVESPSYYGHLTGQENLEIARRILGVSPSNIEHVLERVRLTNVADKKVKQYSLGMKQRLGIALALLGNPEILILDEPTNGLDPGGMQEVRSLIQELSKEQGVTILVSSHLLSEIDQIAHRVGIIRRGKMIFQDRMETLREMSRPRMRLGVNRVEEATRYLTKIGWSVSCEGEHIWSEGLTNQETATMVETLVKGKFSVYRIEEVKQPLEEIFLGLTGKEEGL
ncbi:ABC transporter ATP-binding protein [Marininema halotolerans]|uniref:ABC-2 type transport system ATP-binding protein n=1 Tax=Marininema halotolerans TaxID=1155944 RepID=A0A1I6NSG9_9BACL|nr:ABC transporter ATP-binding protein [Marininema halotolerans]SFS30864.1 ABC-2 type transport system ATP-binding protein [Marininema halotolerans]